MCFTALPCCDRPGGIRWRSRSLVTRGGFLAHPDSGAALGLKATARERICFDELVVDDWLHIEQMDDRQWWLSLGGVHIWVRIPVKGPVVVSHDGKLLSEYGLRADS